MDGEDCQAAVLSPDGFIIAETVHVHTADPQLWDAVHVANMRLISASPDLLAACKEALESLTLSGDANPFVLEALSNAVAKAEGTATREEQRVSLPDVDSDADE